MGNSNNTNGQNSQPQVSLTEYNRMILTQLDNLNLQMKDMTKYMTDKFNAMDHKILKINIREDKIDELVDWRNSVTEVASVNDLRKIKDKSDEINLEQLKDLKKEVKELRDFKIKAITIFGFVQVMMAVFTFWQKL